MEREQAHQIIREITIEGIRKYIQAKLKKANKFQVLDLIFPEERKIRSIIGGLETSLGTRLWEPVAKKLAILNDFEIVNERLMKPTHMPSSLANVMNNIIEDRENELGQYDGESSRNTIKQACQIFLESPINDFSLPKRGGGVDIWLRKNGENFLFDIKTVRPNLDSFNKFVNRLITWHAYFYAQYPAEIGIGKIIFPYNPHDGDFWENSTEKGGLLDPHSEAMVEDEFWDFITGLDNTFQIFRDVFEEIREEKKLHEQLQILIAKS